MSTPTHAVSQPSILTAFLVLFLIVGCGFCWIWYVTRGPAQVEGQGTSRPWELAP